ncbi:MAG: ribosomal protein S18-alanine N-acetyltransferase, partial [Fenollaria timonensis]
QTDDQWTIGGVESELKIESSKAFVYVDEEGAVGGFVDIKILYDEADLMHIAVSEEMRGQGIGARLLAKAIEEAEGKAIALEVRMGNFKAISLYEKYDFKKESVRKNYYHGEDAAIMWRRK